MAIDTQHNQKTMSYENSPVTDESGLRQLVNYLHMSAFSTGPGVKVQLLCSKKPTTLKLFFISKYCSVRQDLHKIKPRRPVNIPSGSTNWTHWVGGACEGVPKQCEGCTGDRSRYFVYMHKLSKNK